MADKRISQLVDRGTVANNDVVPIVVSGATTTNKATISSIQTYMQGNLDLGVTSVGITLGSSGTDVSVSGSPITSSGNITINLPTASATNRGLLSAADWVTFNSKQDAGSFVTLDTTQTITAQKTFTTSGSSDTMIISHGSGSGFALDVLKAGDGEAIRVTKTSGSGNAMTISGGNFEAGTIVKTGGTSSQFLKADGSVDSNTYLTTGSAGSTYVPYSGAAANVDLGVYNITASAIIANGSGSNAGIVHLESNAFFSLVNGYGSIASGTTNQFNLYQTTAAGVFRGAILSLNSITASATRTYTLPDASGTLALSTDLGAYLPLTGGTLTGALNGTSASFSGNVEIGNTVGGSINSASGLGNLVVGNGGASSQGITIYTASSTYGGLNFADATSGGGAYAGYIKFDHSNDSMGFFIGNTPRLTIASTGAATFSSSVGVGGTNTDSLLTINGTAGTTHERFREGSTTIGFIGGANGIITGHNGKLAVRAESGLVLSGSGNSPDFIIASGGAATFSSSVTANGRLQVISGFADQIRFGTNTSVYTNISMGTGFTVFDSIGGDAGAYDFRDDGQSRLFINSSGNVGIGTASPATKLDVVGDIRTSTGILFGADTAAANALDDYEEGTWTPVVKIGTTTNSAPSPVGKYTKIGNVVYIQATITSITKSSTGGLTVQGLPFTVGTSFGEGHGVLRWDDITSNGVIYPYFNSGNTNIIMQDFSNNGYVDTIQDTQIGSTYQLYGISGFYMV